MQIRLDPERLRLQEAEKRLKHWRRWGPYLAERSWGVVREDYSENGEAWCYFGHDHARMRAYRWTEDGILGICDNHQRLCFALAFWNGKDAILKERLFGLSGPQGNHGEDVKEVYYYLDATPTASYLKGLYKYPQAAFPYRELVEENARRSRLDPEFELEDTGIFNGGRYFDIFAEYAKNDVDDMLIKVCVVNRGPEAADLMVLPTLWFRNTWVWYRDCKSPKLSLKSASTILAGHEELGKFTLSLQDAPDVLFTDNETNSVRLWGKPTENNFYKDGFHNYLIDGQAGAINPEQWGTKAAAVYRLNFKSGETKTISLRLCREGSPVLPRETWSTVFEKRRGEADLFYRPFVESLPTEAQSVHRQATAGLFWSKQFYHFVVETWLNGDEAEPVPPPQRKLGRNHQWRHLFNEDIISMPDKWEYPWYAAWDLAFHCVAIAPADPDFAKSQLALFLREWYMHPNGQISAYEWAFGDANPPVHAWACWRVFKIDEKLKGEADYPFLERVFHKLLVNFTWWVNRKDSEGANIFEGGFLGLDNIGIFNRSDALPSGWLLEQSDGSSWMAMFCLNMLKMALRLSSYNVVYEDIASKFFEHFLYISDAINHHQGSGLWDEEDGFYYDGLRGADGDRRLLRVRSLVGLVPLFAADTLEADTVVQRSGFNRRMQWFLDNRPDLTEGLASMTERGVEQRRLLSVVNPIRLIKILRRVFDEREFLSPYGVRSMSRFHKENPYTLSFNGSTFKVGYEPGDSQSSMFGGNSNWRGPVWFPMNLLLIEALQRLEYYFGDAFLIEFPTGSGRQMRLGETARELSQRLTSLFLPDAQGRRPVYGNSELFQHDPHFRKYVLFYEFFHGDTGKGLGASHQTGWTGLVAKLLQQSGT
ncbi:MAG: hypothetical protein JWP08_1070 [Bryobacterales bacterium]|nr:hypothetical protein [Bryobacterales bacterium]